MRRRPHSVLLLTGAFALVAPPAQATYSIAACDPMTGDCGVAVQTDNLAVGSSVPWAQAGVGAIASQFETNPRHGPAGLPLLAQGRSPEETLQQLLRDDGNFEGRGIEARQVAVVSLDGRTAVYTGADAAQANWAGSRTGRGFSVQGNSLVGPEVLVAMQREFVDTAGPLAERLLAALNAGDRAGGQKTGRQSAALLVRTRNGFPLDVDLRVDGSSDPVGELSRLYALHAGRQQIIQARLAARRGDVTQAESLLATGLARVSGWPRGLLLAAEVAVELEEPTVAIPALDAAFGQNPLWLPEALGQGTFASLGHLPDFRRFVGAQREEGVLADYRKSTVTPTLGGNDCLTLAARLLEAGHAAEALEVLRTAPATSRESFLLRATAYAALGQLADAAEQCRAGLRAVPGDPRLRLKLSRLQSPSLSRP